MILAIDIGNTNIVLGCVDEKAEKILFTERISTDHHKTDLEHAISIKTVLELHHVQADEISGAIIASVVPPITGLLKEAVRKVTGCTALVVGPGVRTGLNIRMDNPATVGADLIVGAVAAIRSYPCPLIVIDMGTATTMIVVDADKTYIGGVIMPGIRVSLDSLTGSTSQLPRISIDPPKRLIGKNTVECMKSGILYGHASMLDGMIDRITGEIGAEPTVIATGGLSPKIAPFCRHRIHLDDTLLMRGLLAIYNRNRGD